MLNFYQIIRISILTTFLLLVTIDVYSIVCQTNIDGKLIANTNIYSYIVVNPSTSVHNGTLEVGGHSTNSRSVENTVVGHNFKKNS